MNVATLLSEDFPIEVSDREYEALKKQTKQGWSNCETDREWLVKLHYLRSGFKEGKIPKEDFFKREKDLVLNWWNRWT